MTADPGNAGLIYLGGSNVDATHARHLAAGATADFPAKQTGNGERYLYDLADFFVDAANNTENVFVVALTRTPLEY